MTEVLLANAYIKGASDLLQGKIEGMPQVVVIPDNTTNGDMIKAMFPKMFCDTKGQTEEFTGMTLKDWWNAPYKKEVEK